MMFPIIKFFFPVIIFIVFASPDLRAQMNRGVPSIPRTAPSPENNPFSEAKASLGKKLFFDPRLSITGKKSCHSCHTLVSESEDKMISGTDNQSVSVGIAGLKGKRNASTVLNAALRSDYFWDGRAKSLEEQAVQPFINPVEMGMSDYDSVVKRLEAIPGYVEEFKKVFGKEREKNLRK